MAADVTALRPPDDGASNLRARPSRPPSDVAADARHTQSVEQREPIAAIATPPGEGAVGIVRLSGRGVLHIAARVFRSPQGRTVAVEQLAARRVSYGFVVEDGAPLDEVLLHVMPGPRSYTREDVVEINCHGGAGPLQAVLEGVLRQGARLAEPGEFTRRAFLNGRIDLVQAEAVIDRIQAQTRAALRAADSAAEGALSREVRAVKEVLEDARARVEAAVDFPEEDLPELVDDALRRRLSDSLQRLDALLATAETGRLLREGARVALIGRPNVGKSSLFNALLRDARAIVTAQPGTTRDMLEEVVNIGGIPVRLADTAGLRAAEDEVEQLGVDAARRTLAQADAILFVVDGNAQPAAEDEAIAREAAALEAPILLAVNKADLFAPENPGALGCWAPIPEWAAPAADSCVAVSARSGAGLQELEQRLARLLGGAASSAEGAPGPSAASGSPLLTRVYQRDHVRRAREALARVLEAYDASPEFLSIDLRDAVEALGAVTGENAPADALDSIFSRFCIGK
jgi:tRNA modification GTPase